MKKPMLGLFTALLLLHGTSSAAAVDIHGFGQIVGGSTLDSTKVAGLLYDDDVSFAPESLVALQITAPMGDGFDAVGQLMGRGREDYEARFAWAYLRYSQPGWTLQAGRQRVPFYRFSDHLEVGTAYPFLRPSKAVYRIPYSNYQGVSLAADRAAGRWNLHLQAIGGNARESFLDFGGTFEVETEDLLGASFEATYDEWLLLRASAFRSREVNRFERLEPLLLALSRTGEDDAARALAVDGDRADFLGMAIEIQRRALLLGAEYVYLNVEDSLIARRDSAYVYAGYRLGRWTPTLTHGRSFGRPKRDAAALIDPAHPLAGAVARLLVDGETDDRYSSVGLRYDWSKLVALKLDYTHYDSGREGQSSADLLAAGVVFAF